MSQMLEFPEPSTVPTSLTTQVPVPLSPPTSIQKDRTTTPSGVSSFAPPSGSQIASYIPTLINVVGRILEELETNSAKLLSLNPSRRETIAQYLDSLAGVVAPPLSLTEVAGGGLRKRIEGQKSPAQISALRSYFEEVALIALGQILLLKTWSDRGIRRWSESDLGRLNWALSTALKPHLPLDREGWQITRPNLYSWYNPGTRLQHEIWNALESWRITDEGPQFLRTLLGSVRKAQPEIVESTGYDRRFFKVLWDQISHLGFNPEPEKGILKRNKVIFSPTLRDGSLARSGPPHLVWIGLEASPFQFMMGELMQIWWGPAAPPFWSIGTGLEVHTRDQLTFALGSPKPSVVSRIAEMEACDAAFVLEEHTIRAQGRNANSVRFREQLEGTPYFKKLRSPGTSLGALQACVALTKLRPGGILVWAREEALSSKDGSEILNFLLDRAKLCCEWDFSELEHSLPVALPLYPKHLYLFQKETNLEARHSHRPTRHVIQGLLRSHVELPLVLEDALTAPPTSTRGQWTVLSHFSPTSQRDWMEKWPDPTSHSLVRQLDQLRMASLPLANFTTIRPTPEGDSGRNGTWSLQTPLRGIWLSAEHDTEGRRIVTKPLPRPGQEVQGTGFLVLVSDETWDAPLRAYLSSEWVHQWLDYHAERRGDRWILNEQVVKWIPVPKMMLKVLGVPNARDEHSDPGFASPLPDDWERWAAEIQYRPKDVKEALEKLPLDAQHLLIHSSLFIRTARALETIQSGQNRLFSIVSSDGRIRWRELIAVLPKAECVAITLHPKIRISGTLPAHLPIGKIDRVKSPSPGILFSTESGFSLHLASDSPLLLTMLWEQLEGLSHPTWNELIQYLRLPRKLEFAESTALDVLNAHSEQMARFTELKNLLATCHLF